METLPPFTEILGLGAIRLVIFALMLIVGGWLVISGFRRLLQGHLLRGPLRAGWGVLLGALALLLAGIGINLHTYQRLNYEQAVATVELQQIDARQFQLLLRRADGRDQAYGLLGNQFQLDARVLKWKAWGALLGLDPQFRLERLSGRYASSADEQAAPRSIYGLQEIEQGIDVWHWSQAANDYLPLVDTVYGSAAYMPMVDGAVYDILMTEDGLIARPKNAIAKRAVANW